MGPLSSPVVTSYGLHIVTIGLSLTVFAVLRLVTDGRKIWSSKRGTMQQSALAANRHHTQDGAVSPSPSWTPVNTRLFHCGLPPPAQSTSVTYTLCTPAIT